MSYFSKMRVATYDGSRAMAAHQHETDTICLPLAGSYLEQTRGRETLHGLCDILFCPRNEEHAQVFHAGRVVKLLITPSDIGRGYLSEHMRIEQAPYASAQELGALAVRLAAELGRDELHSTLIAEGIGLEMLGIFSRVTVDRSPTSRRLADARDFVRANACKAIRIADVAAHVGYDPVRLAVAYRRTFGSTIGADARSQRLSHAASMLTTTAEPLAEIAAECGFYDQAHFTRVFRQAFGVTPGRYRAAAP